MKASPRKFIGSMVLAVAALGTAAPQAAAQPSSQPPSERQVRAWAATCAACHNTDGRSIGGFPALAGRNADDTYRALMEFQSGKRPATIMHQHARGYTSDELRRIADWFANVKPAR
ncbi:MAG: c-type cytochrome [bacterium]|jgi:cytochrome c553|nr:c-type cytochrome [Betaproteobacteria bacterium]